VAEKPDGFQLILDLKTVSFFCHTL